MVKSRNIEKFGRPKTINPYRTALGLVWNRLPWDLRPISWRSRRRIRGLLHLNFGKSCIVCCNGPSLRDVAFEKVQGSGVFCIALNKINLIFDSVVWRPQAICACNVHVIKQNIEFFDSTSLPLFLDRVAVDWVEPRKNVTFLHSVPVNRFAEDMSWSYVQGCTVTYMALQLAFHMGFSRVALVGCDHNFSAKGPAHLAVKAGEKDPDHFDPRYFSGGVTWQLPDLVASEYFYALAERHFREAGRQLVNATEGGKLELLPRCSLDEFLKGA